jgi:predicted RNase H-like HicB family nuclease
MKKAYPVIFKKLNDGQYLASACDLAADTQGKDLFEAIEMARDAIGLIIMDMEDDKREIPNASKIEDINLKDNEIVSLVDIDTEEYRRQNETRTIRRSVTIPRWLNEKAIKEKINVSAVLREELKRRIRSKVKMK